MTNVLKIENVEIEDLKNRNVVVSMTTETKGSSSARVIRNHATTVASRLAAGQFVAYQVAGPTQKTKPSAEEVEAGRAVGAARSMSLLMNRGGTSMPDKNGILCALPRARRASIFPQGKCPALATSYDDRHPKQAPRVGAPLPPPLPLLCRMNPLPVSRTTPRGTTLTLPNDPFLSLSLSLLNPPLGRLSVSQTTSPANDSAISSPLCLFASLYIFLPPSMSLCLRCTCYKYSAWNDSCSGDSLSLCLVRVRVDALT